jgi:hypothetical protein
VRYRLTRKNQGPYGSTLDTDSHPMRGSRWWRPRRRPSSDTAARLGDSAAATDAIVQRLLGVMAAIDAQARLGPVVWRGPSIDDFDAAVDRVTQDLAQAAAAVRVLGARLRREERLATG